MYYMYNDIQNGTSGENIKNKTKRWQYAYALLGWSLSYLYKSENTVTPASVTTSFQ